MGICTWIDLRASVRSIPFLSFTVPIFAWNVPLVSLIFLERSVVFPILLFSSISLHYSIVFFYFFALITEEAFLISPCYSLELCIQMGISFLFSFVWSWNSNALAPWCEEFIHLKRLWCWERLKAGGEWDEMVGWHHQLDGHEFEQALGVVMDRETWHAAVHGVAESQTRPSDWTELRREGKRKSNFSFTLHRQHSLFHILYIPGPQRQ